MPLEALYTFDYNCFCARYTNYSKYVQVRFKPGTSLSLSIQGVCDDIDYIKRDMGTLSNRQWCYHAAMALMSCCTTTLLEDLLGWELEHETVADRLTVIKSKDITGALERADTQLVDILGKTLELLEGISFEDALKTTLKDFKDAYQKLHWVFVVRGHYERTKAFLVEKELWLRLGMTSGFEHTP
jgi:hypothetical protein